MIEIRRYVAETGSDVFGDWLAKLKDARTRAKILVRIDRLAAGNFGDCKPLRDGVWELRIDCGRVTACITPCWRNPVFCCYLAATSASNLPA